MTTNITIATHDWAVKVTTVDRASGTHTGGGVERQIVTETTMTEVVPPHSSRTFHITDIRSVAFDELPRAQGAAAAEAQS